jgi:hypothetical protein
MNQTISTQNYPEPPISEREILRYAGCKDADQAVRTLLDSCLKEARGALSYRVCWIELPTTIDEKRCDLQYVTVESEDLAKNLQACSRAALFAATVGVELDRLILKYSRVAPAKALMLQAIGAERIEALCNAFCAELAEKSGCVLRPRFSPGYGDLSLETQRTVFALLGCEKRIGLSLNESLLMSPTKSVTAFVGMRERGEEYAVF